MDYFNFLTQNYNVYKLGNGSNTDKIKIQNEDNEEEYDVKYLFQARNEKGVLSKKTINQHMFHAYIKSNNEKTIEDPHLYFYLPLVKIGEKHSNIFDPNKKHLTIVFVRGRCRKCLDCRGFDSKYTWTHDLAAYYLGINLLNESDEIHDTTSTYYYKQSINEVDNYVLTIPISVDRNDIIQNYKQKKFLCDNIRSCDDIDTSSVSVWDKYSDDKNLCNVNDEGKYTIEKRKPNPNNLKF